jgi:hypothetical protein
MYLVVTPFFVRVLRTWREVDSLLAMLQGYRTSVYNLTHQNLVYSH